MKRVVMVGGPLHGEEWCGDSMVSVEAMMPNLNQERVSAYFDGKMPSIADLKATITRYRLERFCVPIGELHLEGAAFVWEKMKNDRETFQAAFGLLIARAMKL